LDCESRLGLHNDVDKVQDTADGKTEAIKAKKSKDKYRLCRRRSYIYSHSIREIIA